MFCNYFPQFPAGDTTVTKLLPYHFNHSGIKVLKFEIVFTKVKRYDSVNIIDDQKFVEIFELRISNEKWTKKSATISFFLESLLQAFCNSVIITLQRSYLARIMIGDQAEGKNLE